MRRTAAVAALHLIQKAAKALARDASHQSLAQFFEQTALRHKRALLWHDQNHFPAGSRRLCDLVKYIFCFCTAGAAENQLNHIFVLYCLLFARHDLLVSIDQKPVHRRSEVDKRFQLIDQSRAVDF